MAQRADVIIRSLRPFSRDLIGVSSGMETDGNFVGGVMVDLVGTLDFHLS